MMYVPWDAYPLTHSVSNKCVIVLNNSFCVKQRSEVDIFYIARII